ncbi:MAG TPA: DUF1800 family protein, partial [Pyrinomonadaceae bacterium]|nr:DUF1800 family protein [Pyrinomonadaceae bacterium]
MNLLFPSRRSFARAFSVCGALALLANSLFVAGVAAQVSKGQAAAQKLTEEQRIVHVLNRLAFGARPGDIERVRKMGLENYIEQQLNPSKIDDSLLEAKLRNLPTLQMSNGELLAKYPQPNQILRRLQREGQLPPELAALVQQRQQGQPAQGPQAQSTQQNSMQDDKAMPEKAGPPTVDAERIVGELDASRVLRAVYSERQLQEVMVNFWENHFNIYAQKGADRWFLTSYDRDVIRPNALGNFRDLLEATAKSPAMLFYLDNFQSVTPNPQMPRAMLRRQLNDASGVGPVRAGGVFGGARMRDGEARSRRQAEMARQQQGQNAQQRPPQQR